MMSESNKSYGSMFSLCVLCVQPVHIHHSQYVWGVGQGGGSCSVSTCHSQYWWVSRWFGALNRRSDRATVNIGKCHAGLGLLTRRSDQVTVNISVCYAGLGH